MPKNKYLIGIKVLFGVVASDESEAVIVGHSLISHTRNHPGCMLISSDTMFCEHQPTAQQIINQYSATEGRANAR